ncbi:MAG: hypothetical protein IPG66_15370 [Hydrogenophilales bacterium]|nr:hypothetical protein [Hydrogenophilales bacterium]
MKTNVLIASLFAVSSLAAQAADTPEAAADKMLDPTRNASAFKDPKAFAEWTANLMNPTTSMALAQKGIDPNTYIRMLAASMNPATMQNYMQLTDPNVAMKWLAAGMNPNFYTGLMAPGLNPATYMNWLSAPVSPQALNLMAAPLNPAVYGNWLTAPMNPGAVNAMMAPMNPNLYMNWMGAGMNPATYGSWGQMLAAPAQAVAPMAPMQPAVANPFDPNVLLKFMTAPVPQAAGK